MPPANRDVPHLRRRGLGHLSSLTSGLAAVSVAATGAVVWAAHAAAQPKPAPAPAPVGTPSDDTPATPATHHRHHRATTTRVQPPTTPPATTQAPPATVSSGS